MLAALDHLGGQVVERAAEGGAPIAGRVHAPAEIANLELAVDTQEEILWLDVPMNDVLGVEVGERIGHLIDVDGAAPLREGAVLCELLVELALSGKLEHEEDALLIVEITVKTEDVWVSEVLLDLDLATDLLLHSGLDDLGLVEALEGEDVIWLDLGADHVNAAKFALSQGAADVKVGKMPFAGGAGP